MKIKGIIRDNIIHLSDKINVTEGTEVIVEIPESSLITIKNQWQELQKVIGAWKDDIEIDTIFADIDKERHNYHGREINIENIE